MGQMGFFVRNYKITPIIDTIFFLDNTITKLPQLPPITQYPMTPNYPITPITYHGRS